MTMRTLEFVRSAHPSDDAPSDATLWCRDDGDGPQSSFIWLLPQDVIQAGLVERMREGLAREAEDGFTVLEPLPVRDQTPQSQAPAAPAETPDGPLVLGGHTEDWQWQFVQEDGRLVVALDNKPQVEAAAAAHAPIPAYYNAVVPLEVLEAVLSTAKPG